MSSLCTSQGPSSAASGFHCLSYREGVGLVAVAVAGFASLTAVVVIFALIIRNFIREWRTAGSGAVRLTKPMEVFMLSLFAADFLQSLGVSLEVRWIHGGVVYSGSLCTVQGALQNIGQSGIAFTTIIITLHTFASLWWRYRWEYSVKFALTVISLPWLYLILIIPVSVSIYKNPPLYIPTPYWCWINSSYEQLRITLENCWLWIGFGVSVLYIPLIFMIQGYVTPDDDIWWKFKINPVRETDQSGRRTRYFVYMAVGALSYILPILPTALSRWILIIHGDNKPFSTAEAQLILKGIFSLSGVIDAIVFRLTRRNLLLFEPQQPVTNPAIPLGGLGQNAQAPHLNGEDPRGADPAVGGPAAQPPGNVPADNAINPQLPAPPPAVFNKKVSAVLLATWFIVNAFDVAWIKFYIQDTTVPNPRNPSNEDHTRWIPFYLLMYVFGFYWGLVNIFVCGLFFVIAFRWFGAREHGGGEAQEHQGNEVQKKGRIRSIIYKIRAWSFPVLWYLVHVLILFPMAMVVSLGPFFGPQVALRISQQISWDRTCNIYSGFVILDGPQYNAPADENPRASFFYRQNTTWTKLYQYNMTNSTADNNLWDLHFATVEPGVTVPPSLYPLVQNVSIDLGNNTFSTICPNISIPCESGSFNIDGYLSITTTNSSGSTSRLKAIDPVWYYTDSEDAPSYILKDEREDSSLGDIAIRTVVTEPGHSGTLKLCVARVPGGDLMAAVGLTLIELSAYSRRASTPNSN